MGHRDTLQQPQPGLTLPAATCPSPGHSAPVPLAVTSPLQNVPSLSPGHTSDPHREQEQGRGQPQPGGQRTQPGRAGRTGKLSPLESQECQERQEATLPHSQEGLRVHREGGEGRAPSLLGGPESRTGPRSSRRDPHPCSLSPVTAPCPRPPLPPVCPTGTAPGGAGDPSPAQQAAPSTGCSHEL